jgi:hypothetical protein
MTPNGAGADWQHTAAKISQNVKNTQKMQKFFNFMTL